MLKIIRFFYPPPPVKMDPLPIQLGLGGGEGWTKNSKKKTKHNCAQFFFLVFSKAPPVLLRTKKITIEETGRIKNPTREFNLNRSVVRRGGGWNSDWVSEQSFSWEFLFSGTERDSIKISNELTRFKILFGPSRVQEWQRIFKHKFLLIFSERYWRIGYKVNCEYIYMLIVITSDRFHLDSFENSLRVSPKLFQIIINLSVVNVVRETGTADKWVSGQC